MKFVNKILIPQQVIDLYWAVFPDNKHYHMMLAKQKLRDKYNNGTYLDFYTLNQTTLQCIYRDLIKLKNENNR